MEDDPNWSWLTSGAAPLTKTEPAKDLDPDKCPSGGACPVTNCGQC